MIKGIIRFLISLAAPFILIFAGAGIAGVGLEYNINFLAWAGGILIVCGVLWIGWYYLLADAGS